MACLEITRDDPTPLGRPQQHYLPPGGFLHQGLLDACRPDASARSVRQAPINDNEWGGSGQTIRLPPLWVAFCRSDTGPGCAGLRHSAQGRDCRIHDKVVHDGRIAVESVHVARHRGRRCKGAGSRGRVKIAPPPNRPRHVYISATCSSHRYHRALYVVYLFNCGTLDCEVPFGDDAKSMLRCTSFSCALAGLTFLHRISDP
jgi:hypothetical protein